jgi:hypothetical protein
MNLLARTLAVGALALGAVATGGTAHADSGPVPEEWGQPTLEFAQLQVIGREMGRLPGRLGNQHVTAVDTVDEDSVVNGYAVDWWCPTGVIAPSSPPYPGVPQETPCRLKAQYSVEYDYPRVLTENWSPTLRYLNLRIPIKLVDWSAGGPVGVVVDRGNVSIHVKGTGDLSLLWHEGDYLDVLTRHGAYLTGGKFLGRPWLGMSSVGVINDEMWLLRYYG